MADDPNPLDDLPKRDLNQLIEEKAEAAFQSRLAESSRFILQRADRKDYGTDCEIEVVDQGRATNVRIHVQLKGTKRALKADGSLSITVSRSNLNYLLMHPHSLFAAYHLPTNSLQICLAEAVHRRYEHEGKDWTKQDSITVTFAEELTVERLDRLAALAKSAARSSRDRRVEQSRAAPETVASLLRRRVPEVEVPDNPRLAVKLLEQLYVQNADEMISAAFDRFAAVLGRESDPLGFAYMAEINLGMAGLKPSRARVEAAIAHFTARLDHGRYQPGSLSYTIGNAFSALGKRRRRRRPIRRR